MRRNPDKRLLARLTTYYHFLACFQSRLTSWEWYSSVAKLG